jgi:peptide/nickel transport system substrate-binding protein
MESGDQHPWRVPISSSLSRRRLFQSVGLAGATAIGLPVIGAALDACAGGGSRVNGGATVTYAISTEPRVLSPPTHTLAVESTVMSLLFGGLLRMTAKGDFEPDLAETYIASSDYMTYRFRLRKGLKWQDGLPLTSRDWKFTWQVYVNPKTASFYVLGWDKIEAVETPDDRQIVVHMKAPYAAFLVNVASDTILPQHVLQRDFDTVPRSSFNHNPVGCGPFRLKSWRAGAELVLEANPHYWRGRPLVDRFVFKIIPDVATQLMQLRTGSVDVMSPTLDQWSQVRSMAPEIAHLAYPGTTYVLVQLDEYVFLRDPRVRQALDYATPKTTIVKDVLAGLAEVGYADIPPESPYYEPRVERHVYDLARATALLQEAGFSLQNGAMTARDGRQLAVPLYTIGSSRRLVEIAHLIKQSWLELGVKTWVQGMEGEALFGNGGPQWNGKDAGLIYGWDQGVDPDDYVNWNSTQIQANADAPGDNDGRYVNPDIDRLTVQGQAQPDPAQRKQIYSRIQQILAADVPAIFLCWPRSLVAYNSKLKGFRPNAYAGPLWNVYQWSISQ